MIIDEFQNITQYIYPDKERRTEPDETLAGSFHDVVESKIAPMLVTGSYVGWLITVINKYLEAGRLKRYFINPMPAVITRGKSRSGKQAGSSGIS
ncbi:hypothetical protein QUF80_06110 [Desulfococcaceae bacterium HSG8]|nr:hypothetical protein [Desulfococcaceae bacterium HSG8]